MYTIYALIDPRDNTPKYVGIIDCPPLRLREHLRNLEGGREKRAWIRELQGSELAPSMEELETGTYASNGASARKVVDETLPPTGHPPHKRHERV